jgi:SAM-dependent methyltransferase
MVAEGDESVSCPICKSKDLMPLFKRPRVPVHQHLLFDTPQAARMTPFGFLEIVACQYCHLVFNLTFEPSLMNYGSNYDNAQTHSPAFSSHLQERIDYLLKKPEFEQGTVLEIGCGNGDFLNRLLLQAKPNCLGWGFDPSYQGALALLDGRLQFSQETLEKAPLPQNADAVICRHVIEHIEKPLEWLCLLRKTLEPFSEVKLYFETPALEWILQGQVFWDFFYEHCNYFSAATLKFLFQSAGFIVTQQGRVFGEQYHWLEAKLAPDSVDKPISDTQAQLKILLQNYLAREKSQLQYWRENLIHLTQKGPLALWGAGAKGVTLASLLDPQARIIDCIVDMNPAKQGRYLPGTGHLILAPENLVQRKIQTALLMNPQYAEEIRQFLQKQNLELDLVLPE